MPSISHQVLSITFRLKHQGSGDLVIQAGIRHTVLLPGLFKGSQLWIIAGEHVLRKLRIGGTGGPQEMLDQ